VKLPAIFLKEIPCFPVWQDFNEKIFLGAHFNACIWASRCLNNLTTIMMITPETIPDQVLTKYYPITCSYLQVLYLFFLSLNIKQIKYFSMTSRVILVIYQRGSVLVFKNIPQKLQIVRDIRTHKMNPEHPMTRLLLECLLVKNGNLGYFTVACWISFSWSLW